MRRCEQRGERRRRVAGGANAMRIMSVSVSVECGHARGVKRAHVGLEPGGRVQDRLKLKHQATEIDCQNRQVS